MGNGFPRPPLAGGKVGRRPGLWAASVLLLALPLVVPPTDWSLTLLGYGKLDAEIEGAKADGYYEDLIRAVSADRGAAKPLPACPPGWVPFADSGAVEVVADYRRWTLRPGADLLWNGTVFRTNRLGQRGPEVRREKPPGAFRVVVLGSSNTLGHGVHDDDLYTRRLEAWLARRVGPGRRAEVLNLAVSGDSPTQRLERLRTEVAGLRPDWILCDVTALDVSLEEGHLRWVVGQGVPIPYSYVREAVRISGVTAEDSPAVFHKKFGPIAQPVLKRTYAAWGAESRRLGVPLTVVILPRADSKTESPRLFQLFRETAERYGMGCLDLSGTFDRLPLDEYRVAPWDQHPNALGHRLIFEALADALEDHDGFNNRLNGRGRDGDGLINGG